MLESEAGSGAGALGRPKAVQLGQNNSVGRGRVLLWRQVSHGPAGWWNTPPPIGKDVLKKITPRLPKKKKDLSWFCGHAMHAKEFPGLGHLSLPSLVQGWPFWKGCLLLKGRFVSLCTSLKHHMGCREAKKKGHLPAPLKKISAFSVLARRELVANG